MKAIVFSNWPSDQYEEKFGRKLASYGVEVRRVVRADAEPGKVDDVDVLIALHELMSTGQAARIKEMAKVRGKSYAGLNRRSSDWGRILGQIQNHLVGMATGTQGSNVTPIRRGRPPTNWHFGQGEQQDDLQEPPSTTQPIEAAPPSEPPASKKEEEKPKTPEERIQELEGINSLYEEENDSLTNKLDEAKRTIIRLNDGLHKSAEEHALLLKKIASYETASSNAQAEVLRYKKEAADLRIELTSAKAKGPKATNDIWAALDSIRSLVRLGIMSPDEAFEKLMNFKPKG